MSTTTFDPSQSPPVPQLTELTQFHWDALKAHRLELLRCQACGHYIHYPRAVCDRCLSTDVAPEEISGRGTLYSYCEAMQASHPYFAGKVPYLLGIIDVEEEQGVRLPTRLVECVAEDLRCGLAMEVVFEDVTPTLTLAHFRPSAGADR